MQLTSPTWTTNVQKLVLENGSVSNTFAFNLNGEYLCATSNTNNNMGTRASVNGNASWAISINADHEATIEAQGTYTHNNIRYNASSPRFSCYLSTSTLPAVCLYKWVCADVESVNATAQATTAQATWSSLATSFVAELNGTPVTNFTQNGSAWTCDLTDLTPNTNYTFRVKADCQTDFVETNFTTGCLDYSASNTINASIYEGQVYPLAGDDYSVAGTYTIPMTDAYGCDSIITLILEVLTPLNVHREDVSACDT